MNKAEVVDMKLLILEMKKIVSNYVFLICTVILLIVYFVKVINNADNFPYQEYGVRADFFRAYQAGEVEYDALKALYADGNIDFTSFSLADAGYAHYGTSVQEYSMTATLVEQYEYAAITYEEDMTELIHQLNTELFYALQNNSKYRQRSAAQALHMYNRVRQLAVMDAKLYGEFIDGFYTHRMANFFLLLILWMVCIASFSLGYEKHSGMELAVFSCRNGRNKLLLAKLGALSLTAAGLCLILFLTEIITGAVSYQIADFTIPLQSVSLYEYCPFSISLLGAIFVFNLMRFAAMLAIIGCVAILNIGSRHFARTLALGTLLVGGGGYVVLLWLARSLDASGVEVYNAVRAYVPLALLLPEEYLDHLDFINLFGFPVFRIWLCAAVAVAICVFGGLLSSRFYGKAARKR